MATSPPTFTAAELAAWRTVADPLADDVIADIYRGGHLAAVNALLTTMVRHDVPPPALLPPAARDYFDRTAVLPDWIDRAAILRGEAVFMRYGLLSLASLLCASLPECYAMRNGVQVLSITQQLGAHTERRIYETAQMVVDVMADGGLLEGGQGMRSSQKVRLMHAAMRYLLEVDPGGVESALRDGPTLACAMTRTVWNPSWGRPINQADMAFTLQTFSTVVLRSWARMGVPLDADERAAYYHCWRVVGHVLGVDEALNPPTVEGGEAVFEALRAHQQGPTAQGLAMTRSLSATVAQTIGIPWISHRAVALMMRHLLGNDTASMMGVPTTSTLERVAMAVGMRVVRAVSVVAEGVADEVPLVHRLSARFGGRFIAHIARLDRGGPGRRFVMPPTLDALWRQ